VRPADKNHINKYRRQEIWKSGGLLGCSFLREGFLEEVTFSDENIQGQGGQAEGTVCAKAWRV
jgi:hypothetical protein